MAKAYVVHYTPDIKGKDVPSKAGCGKNDPFAWTKRKNEVSCESCRKVAYK